MQKTHKTLKIRILQQEDNTKEHMRKYAGRAHFHTFATVPDFIITDLN